MTEEVLAILPASEIWGVNRKTPCNIVLTDERMVVIKGERGSRGRRPLPTLRRRDVKVSELDALPKGDHYSLPYERIRWVEFRKFLTATLLKVGTPGGGYRFRLRRRPATRMKRRMKQLLGDLVRER